MFIRYLRICNFRGIDHFEGIMKKNILSIVGQNDVGKSSVLRAICVFLDKEKMLFEDFPNFDVSKQCEIEIHFETTTNYIIQMKRTFDYSDGKIISKQFIYKELSLPTEEELNDYKLLKGFAKTLGIEVPTKKPSQSLIAELKTTVLRIGTEQPSFNWYEDDWKDFSELLPEIIYIPAAQDHLSEQKMTSDSSLFGKLFRVGLRKWLNADPESKDAINVVNQRIEHINKLFINKVEDKLKEQLPLAENLNQKIDPLDVSKGFSFTMTVRDAQGIETALNNRGSGLQRSVLVAVIRAQSEVNKMIEELEIDNNNRSYTRPILYIFEEPEAFLHLSAQKELFYSLKDLSDSGSQVIITTHSTLFIDESNRDDIVLLTRTNGQTNSLQHIPDEEIRDHLGERIKISELLTGKVCCLVEGKSDKFAFEYWADKLGLNHRRDGVHFISMDGCRQLDYFANVKILLDFNIPFRIILDKDSHGETTPEARKLEFEQKYPKLKHGYIKILTKGELENYFCLDTVSSVLKIERTLINERDYCFDPKKALSDATQLAIRNGVHARKYREGEHSREICSKMPMESIDEEIKAIIHELAEISGRNDESIQQLRQAFAEAAVQ